MVKIVCNPELRSQHIAKTRFTIEWLLDALDEKDEKWQSLSAGQTLDSFDAVDISAGKGFASRIYKVTLKFAGGNDPLAHAVVMKVPGFESFEAEIQKEDYGSKTELKKGAHKNECNFYNTTKNVPGLPLPCVFKSEIWDYAAGQDGVILMEYLGNRATTGEIYIGMTVEQMEALAIAVAHFQAYVLLQADQSWISTMKMFNITDPSMADMITGMTEASINKRPHYFADNYRRMKTHFRDIDFWHNMASGYQRLGIAPVLAHGDLWTNNIMWKKDDEGKAGNELAAIIDWQLIHTGSCGEDLARVMTLCAEGDLRRKHELRILRLYHDKLSELLKKGGMEVPFTIDQVELAYRFCFCYQTVQVVQAVTFFINAQPADVCKELSAQREELLFQRAKLALDDAVAVAEKHFPDLLDKVE